MNLVRSRSVATGVTHSPVAAFFYSYVESSSMPAKKAKHNFPKLTANEQKAVDHFLEVGQQIYSFKLDLWASLPVELQLEQHKDMRHSEGGVQAIKWLREINKQMKPKETRRKT